MRSASDVSPLTGPMPRSGVMSHSLEAATGGADAGAGDGSSFPQAARRTRTNPPPRNPRSRDRAGLDSERRERCTARSALPVAAEGHTAPFSFFFSAIGALKRLTSMAPTGGMSPIAAPNNASRRSPRIRPAVAIVTGRARPTRIFRQSA